MLIQDEYIYLYKRDKPFIIKIVGFLVAIYALFVLVESPIFGILMVLASIGMFSFQKGIEVNFKNNTYRLITSFGPINIGEWIKFPDLQYISVFRATIKSSIEGRSGQSLSRSHKVIQVNLITNHNRRIRLLEVEDLEYAISFAKELSIKMNLDIWNATEREGKWLEQ